MASPLANLRRSIAEGLESRTLAESCFRWASKRRIMGGGPPYGGPYSDKYFPWVREIHDSPASFNWVMKAAQVGFTEICINLAFYTLLQLRRSVLYLLPTDTNASEFGRSRISAALSESPLIAQDFTDTNTVNLKQAGPATLYIRGTRSESGLVSIPVSQIIFDELDRMKKNAVEMALERMSGQFVKRVLGLSTPTVGDFGIHRHYLSSTQEHFFFRCPACSRMTELVWPDCIEVVGEHFADPRIHESFLKCKDCKAKLNHQDKPVFLKNGIWRPTNEQANPDLRGFYLNQLYSYTVTPGEIVRQHFKSFGDELAAKEFHNQKLAVPYVGEGAKITDEMINAAVGDHSIRDMRPEDSSRLITMGVDQGKTCYATVVEWLLKSNDLTDINAVADCKVLAFVKFGEDEWHILDDLMREWQVQGCVVDPDPQINEARKFARRHKKFVWLCRYRRGPTAKEIAETTDSDVIHVDRANWLSAVLHRFKVNPPTISLPREISEEYKHHLKNVVRTYERDDDQNAVTEFISTGADHFFHSLAYAEIALPLSTGRGKTQSIAKAP